MSPSAPSPAAVEPTATARVLVVDDHADIITLTTRILEREGYEVSSARDGADALEAARRERPDLILLDIMMPRLDGLEVCRQLKGDPETRKTMVLMVTGRGSIDHLVEGLESGADDYITKPFHLMELVARVRSALRIKRLNDEIEAQNRELLNSQRERLRAEKMATIGLLATGIAHEFNNIMNGIAGFAQLARKNAAYQDRLLEVVQVQTDRALQITRSLSTFSRPSRRLGRADVAAEIDNALCLVTKRLAEKNVQVSRTGAPVPPVTAYPGQLQEVFLNLVLNACEAVGADGAIAVDVRSVEAPGRGRQVQVQVRDNGCGIAAADLERIFDPFFTTKGVLGGGHHPGSGLGLSVSYNIVSACGGTLAASSEAGAGTVFTVRLPAAAEEPAARVAAPAGEKSERVRVLIADAEDASRELAAEFLKSCDVVTCVRWQEAKERFDREAFDVAIIDASLAEDGEFWTQLESQLASCPRTAAVLTSSQYSTLASTLQRCGARRHLLKPYSMENLCTIVSLESARTRRR
jgi:signal transduction histidine kinase